MTDFKTHKISSAIGLMLDNLVYNRHGEVHRIRINDLHAFDHPDMGGNYGLYGIPLTEEWLINNAGFKVDDMADLGEYVHLIISHPELYLNWNEGSIWIGEYNTKCKYAHQLQNIYFALTGEELTIK